jgi:hypothetical protein
MGTGQRRRAECWVGSQSLAVINGLVSDLLRDGDAVLFKVMEVW